MDFSADARLQELNRLIQIETDPQKLVALADDFSRRLEALQHENSSESLAKPSTLVQTSEPERTWQEIVRELASETDPELIL